jgi:hypothetical protein
VSLTRALKMLATHSVYEDLRRVEKTNSRIGWTQELARTLAELLDSTPQARERLDGVLTAIARDKQELDRATEPRPRPTNGESLASLAERVVRAATGLQEKMQVGVEVITVQPAAAGAVTPPLPPRLAGSSLANFGGFLDQRLREHDFSVGYHSAVAWMDDDDRGFKAYDLPPDLAARAVNAARAHAPEQAKPASGHLSLGARVRVARLGLRALAIGLLDARALRRRR